METISVCKEAGHIPMVIVSEEGLLTETFRERKIDYCIIPLGIIRRKYYSVKGIINRCTVLAKAFIQVRKIIRHRYIDLIYSNTTIVLIGALLAKVTGKKHIWHVHEITENPRFFHRITGFFLQHMCTTVVAVSHAVKQCWMGVVREEKIQVVHNGFDYSIWDNALSTLKQELQIPANSLLIGTVGRINLIKGQNYFIEIAALIATEFPDIYFVIVGDTYRGYEYLYDELRILQEQKGLQKKLFQLGYRSDVGNIMAGLDIFVLSSSVPDPFPTVILEAMASGKPVVSTHQGGALEMILEDKTGIFVPLANPLMAFEKIKPLIEDINLRKRMGALGRERVVRTFSREQFKTAILKIIE